MLLAVDPGIRGCGAAVFSEVSKELLAATYVRNPDKEGRGLEQQNEMAGAVLGWAVKNGIKFDHYPTLVVEWPQIYPQGRKPGNPNITLLPLCGVLAHLSGWQNWGDRTEYHPRQWKGTMDGDVMTQRILERLTKEEKARIEKCPASLAHNAVDAVGIGLKKLGRLERLRNYAR